MSDFQGSTHSVLLPTAKIQLFVKDEGIKQAALSLKNDWRFARVDISVLDGDVESAIAHFANAPSPDLVLVETLEISEGFPARLEILGSNCAEETAAVVVGPVNDVYLYRKLIEMGVSDYLVKPLTRDVLADVFSKILIERLGASGSRMIACIGAKGGVGTSTISQMISYASADSLQQKTIILDAAGGWSYLSVAMGGDTITTLHEVARAAQSTDKDSFNRMIVAINDKLSYLGTGAESLLDDNIKSESFEIIINRLMQTYPVVIVDLSQAPIDIKRNVLARANDVVVISPPTLSALRSARGLLQETKTIRGGAEHGIHIILNMKGGLPGAEVSDADVVAVLKMKPDLSIAHLPKIFGQVEGQSKTVSSVPGGNDIMQQIKLFLEKKLSFSVDRTAPLPSRADKAGLFDGLLGKKK
jgi:pilus assembly protein CpaE